MPLMSGFAASVHRAGGGHYCSGAQGSKVGNHVLRAIGHHKRNALAFAHAKSLQASSTPIDVVKQLAVSHLHAKINEGSASRIFPRSFLEHFWQCALGKFQKDWWPIAVNARTSAIDLRPGRR